MHELGSYSKEVEMATLHDAITNIPNQWNTLVAIGEHGLKLLGAIAGCIPLAAEMNDSL